MAINQEECNKQIVAAQQTAMLEIVPLLSQPQNVKYQQALKNALLHLAHKVEQIIRSEQIDIIAGRCDVKHGDRTFKEFIEMGGDECPICMKKRLAEVTDKIYKSENINNAIRNVDKSRIILLEETLRETEKRLKQKKNE